MRIVLDTNVVVSAFINPSGPPSQIMKMVLSRKVEYSTIAKGDPSITLFYNSAILSEYESVMLRPKFRGKINPNIIQKFIDLIRSIGASYMPLPGKIKLSDESDKIFYDTAVGSSSILVSGNIKHFPKEQFIMLPADFLRRFRKL